MTMVRVRQVGRSWRTRVPRERLRGWLPRLPLLLLGTAMLVHAGLTLYLGRRSWFGVDAIAYFTQRGPIPALNEGLIKPYGGHWETLPILLYRALFAIFGLKTYLPYQAAALLAHLCITAVTFAILRRVGAPQWIAFVAAWLILFFGAGAEAYANDAPMVLSWALFMGLAALLVLLSTDFSVKGHFLATVLLIASIMCSGAGLAAIMLVAIYSAIERGLVRAFVTVALPAAIFCGWFLSVGRDGRVGLEHGEIWKIPWFILNGLDVALGSNLGIPGFSALLLPLVVAASVIVRDIPPRWRHLAWSGMLTAAGLMALFAFASLRFGSGAGTVGRYQYLVDVLFAPGLAVTLLGGWRLLTRALQKYRGVVSVGVVTAALVGCAWHGISLERTNDLVSAAQARLYRTWVAGGVAAADAGERQLTQTSSYVFDGGEFTLFARPEFHSKLPAPSVSLPMARLETEAQYFVNVSLKDPGSFRPMRPAISGFANPDADQASEAGCHPLTVGSTPARVVFSTGSGTELGVIGDATQIITQVERSGVGSAQRTWNMFPGAVYISTTVKDATMTVTFPQAGHYTVCHQ